MAVTDPASETFVIRPSRPALLQMLRLRLGTAVVPIALVNLAFALRSAGRWWLITFAITLVVLILSLGWHWLYLRNGQIHVNQMSVEIVTRFGRQHSWPRGKVHGIAFRLMRQVYQPVPLAIIYGQNHERLYTLHAYYWNDRDLSDLMHIIGRGRTKTAMLPNYVSQSRRQIESEFPDVRPWVIRRLALTLTIAGAAITLALLLWPHP